MRPSFILRVVRSLPLALCPASFPASAAPTSAPTSAPAAAMAHAPRVIQADARLHLDFGPERVILPGGLQPSLLCTTAGTLIVQGQLPGKPLATKRIHYPYPLQTVISRDGGLTWSTFPIPPDSNGLDLEGGAIQLADKT